MYVLVFGCVHHLFVAISFIKMYRFLRLCWSLHIPHHIDGIHRTRLLSRNWPSISKYDNLCSLFSSPTILRNVTTEAASFCDDVDIHALTNGDEIMMKKLKVLILEVDVMRQEGYQLPSRLKPDEWKELMVKESRTSRRKYLSFLFQKEMKRIHEKQKKIERQMKRAEIKEQKIDGDKGNEHIEYGLSNNTIFMRIRDSTINHMYNWRLMQAMLFGQKLVVDCGYDQNMTTRECVNCAKQLVFLFSENRIHPQPFDIYLCNAVRNNTTMKYFEKTLVTAYDEDFPLNITEKNYLDLFPKESLVYLTPHCRNELQEFDHDAVYIVGGIVDKINQEPLSLGKAKREGLKMAKLPLDRYLLWGSGGSKSLTLNHVIQILLDVKYTGDWKQALKHVPQRKLRDTHKFSKLLGNNYLSNSRKYGY